MSDLTPEERALLGLAPDETVEALPEITPAPSEVASASSAAAISFAEVPAAIEARPDFDPVLREHPQLLKLQWWLPDRGVYQLPIGAELLKGDSITLEGTDIVDARARPALVLVRDGDEQLAMRLNGSRVSPFRLQWKSLREPLPSVSAPDPIVVPALDVAALLAGESCAPWLGEATQALVQSDDASSQVAAVGLLVRVWQPVDADARQREVKRFVSGAPGLVDRARDWLRELSPEVLAAVADQAVDDATHLPERAETLRLAFGENDAVAGAVAVGLVLARDDLASVGAALDLVGGSRELLQALAHCDRAIASHATPLAECEATVIEALGPRIDDTVAADPDAWWLRVFA